MAKSNRDRVSEVLDALRDGLGPFVLREYKMVYKAAGYLREIEQVLKSNTRAPVPDLVDETAARKGIDAQGWLSLMMFHWGEVFKAKLGHAERSYVSELNEHRNAWAHQKPISNEDAYRCADTATRLLEAVGAPTQAQVTRDIAQELLRLRFEAEATKSQSKLKTAQSEATPTTTTPGLKPWRFVVKPHPDVASGRYILADFVANLADVRQGKAQAEYGDAKEFFRRTYLTEGLMSLLVTGVKRLTGLGGDPVVQLQTSFGGGKTHSMLALYHLFSGDIGFSEIPGGERIVEQVGEIDDKITANCAVIVGTAFSATEPRMYPDCTTHTLWGDIAYQLGGVKGYQMVERADMAGISPGSDTLVELLEQFGPALIIIDELVAFARNLPISGERVAAGTFDSVMTFFQSLTEAVKRSSDSMLLVSIPESENEIGGELGKMALDILSKTIGRVESVWKPVTANESFEIVRRRLFSSEMDYAARDAVVNAFSTMYRDNSAEFPSGVGEGDYPKRMRAAYPIHPELFDRLYQDWSTLERFQRTRGVLRLMATVIHKLWEDNDQSLMIMPGSIPLWAANIRNEMLRYLPEAWPAIVDTDIDGSESKTLQLDQSVPVLGQHSACRRVARSIFVGSAPSVAEQAVRGVEEVRIRLATVQPGEPLAVFGDALRRMSQQLTYLYSDGSRYWYDTRPTVNRMAQDRAQNLEAHKVFEEAVKRLRAEKFKREDFAGAHIAPQDTADIVDDWGARVVVLGHNLTHKRGNGTSTAIEATRSILESRGNAPRLYRNTLVFIAADATDAEGWERAIRDYLAWKSIQDEAEPLNLDAQQRKQVKGNLETADKTVQTRMQETYSWLIVPVQPDPTGPVELQAHRIVGQDSFYDRAARKLHQSELLINRWSPDNLSLTMEEFNLWRDGTHVNLRQLWEYFAQYCYLPRLYDENVLLEAVRDGATRLIAAPFGYATMVGNDGSYSGLIFQQQSTAFYFDDKSLLVRPEVAKAQLAEAMQHTPTDTQPLTSPTARGHLSEPATPTKPRIATRYHGTVSLDPQRINREMSTIVEEVIQRLTSLPGTEVQITLEISAERRSGFDDSTVRTINENSRTLKFKSHGFEDG